MGTGNIPDMTGEKIYSYTYAPLIYNADKDLELEVFI